MQYIKNIVQSWVDLFHAVTIENIASFLKAVFYRFVKMELFIIPLALVVYFSYASGIMWPSAVSMVLLPLLCVVLSHTPQLSCLVSRNLFIPFLVVGIFFIAASILFLPVFLYTQGVALLTFEKFFLSLLGLAAERYYWIFLWIFGGRFVSYWMFDGARWWQAIKNVCHMVMLELPVVILWALVVEYGIQPLLRVSPKLPPLVFTVVLFGLVPLWYAIDAQWYFIARDYMKRSKAV